MKGRLFFVGVAVAVATAFCGLDARGDLVVDTYKLTISVYVPRVYDNTQSLGYRKYQRQKVEGFMTLTYDTDQDGARPIIGVESLVNRTHKINGKNVTYGCEVSDDVVFPRVNAIGSNRTGVFKTPTITFHLEAIPSYNVGDDSEDNTLEVVLSGHGASVLRHSEGGRYLIPKTFSGQVAGSLGCGCLAYGHVSPTRTIGAEGPTDHVEDVAAAHGTWKARFVKRSRSVVTLR